jgi:hypothetical protein
LQTSTNNGSFITDASNYVYAQYYNNTLYFGNASFAVSTAAVFRDFSSWYHVFFVVDSTLGTTNDRMQIWVNGVRQTVGTFNIQPGPSASVSFLNNTVQYQIGGRTSSGSNTYFDGYMGEVNFIDGQALAPTSFGQYNEFGVWSPRKYGGSYGTNGFYLPYTNTTSAETLAYDLSNSNPELISNGMFVSNVTGWTAAGSGSPSITWQSNHTMRIANSANNAPWAYTTISTVIGQTYYAQAYIFAASIGGASRTIVLKKADDANYSVNSVDLASTTQAGAPTGLQGTFTATATTTYIIIFADVIGTGTTGIDVSQISTALGAYKKNWNPFNISVTAGVTYDAMTDVPPPSTIQNVAAGNYCVLNPLDNYNNTVSNGNLTAILLGWPGGSNPNGNIAGSMAVNSGKYYWEITVTAATSNGAGIGVARGADGITGYTSSGVYYLATGNSQTDGGSATAYGATYGVNDVIGVALDATGGTVTFYKQTGGTGSFTAYSALTLPSSSSGWKPKLGNTAGTGNSWTIAANFGQRPLNNTSIPTGYVTLNTNNLPAPTIPNGAKVMAAVTYNGTGAAGPTQITATTTNSGNNPLATTFQPDFVWTKGRGSATFNNHLLFDVIRGTTKLLQSNQTAIEATVATSLTSFNNNGFSIGSFDDLNTNGNTYISWQWNAGGAPTPNNNTDGSITSTVSANKSAGFSIITFAASNISSPQTVGHGLGVAPSMFFVKPRTYAGGWYTYHASLGNTKYLELQSTNPATTSSNPWNNTSPSNSVITLGNSYFPDASNSTYVIYAWTPIAGYSAMGSYTGNGSVSGDGPFVYLGFCPRWVLIKSSVAGEGWNIFDTSRDTYNPELKLLFPYSDAVEFNNGTAWADVTSNGFKIRYTTAPFNTSGGTYIYMAFAENPFKLALAR